MEDLSAFPALKVEVAVAAVSRIDYAVEAGVAFRGAETDEDVLVHEFVEVSVDR